MKFILFSMSAIAILVCLHAVDVKKRPKTVKTSRITSTNSNKLKVIGSSPGRSFNARESNKMNKPTQRPHANTSRSSHMSSTMNRRTEPMMPKTAGRVGTGIDKPSVMDARARNDVNPTQTPKNQSFGKTLSEGIKEGWASFSSSSKGRLRYRPATKTTTTTAAPAVKKSDNSGSSPSPPAGSKVNNTMNMTTQVSQPDSLEKAFQEGLRQGLPMQTPKLSI